MYSMIQNRFKAPVTAFITPSCRFLLKIGITANWLTFIGALGSSVSALYFFSYGDFFLGTILASLFALSDLFDGTMARLSERGTTKWGALIDSTLDRATDAAIYAGIIAYAISNGDRNLALLALFCTDYRSADSLHQSEGGITWNCLQRWNRRASRALNYHFDCNWPLWPWR